MFNSGITDHGSLIINILQLLRLVDIQLHKTTDFVTKKWTLRRTRCNCRQFSLFIFFWLQWTLWYESIKKNCVHSAAQDLYIYTLAVTNYYFALMGVTSFLQMECSFAKSTFSLRKFKHSRNFEKKAKYMRSSQNVILMEFSGCEVIMLTSVSLRNKECSNRKPHFGLANRANWRGIQIMVEENEESVRLSNSSIV